ncbi:hypothetical protein O181_035759 [Austropuccinia psidii MF-1]|uniref:DNA-directed RNA polymerase III subunit RPC3 n=1 Tax=Austropuccinia psidii MF-1 TaxID=1389203 RepID=A0A9Q3HAV3_9BASI|nr:hypothetical protein [Austropuccinia psidii MF-1]
MKSIGPQDIRLCEHLLTQFYGHACGEIGSILLNRGRLPFPSLLRMSCLTANSIREALIVLIHQNCVYHSDTSALTSKTAQSSHGPEYFEAIPIEILARIRFDQYINLTFEQFGLESKLIIESVLNNGKLRIGQLTSIVCDQYQQSPQAKLEIDQNQPKHYSLKITQIVKSNILNLLADRYLKPADPTHSINPIDLELALEKQMIADLPGVPSAKDFKLVKEQLAGKLNDAKDQEFQLMCSFEQKKRKLAGVQNDWNGQVKRQKTDEAILEDDMLLRVNYNRFNIKIRNSIFSQECLRWFNSDAAMVIKAMLSIAETKQRDCSDLVSEPISAQSIILKLGNRSKSIKSSFPITAANGQFNLKLKNTGDLVAELLSIIAKQDDLATSTSSAYLAGSLDKALSQLNPIPMVSEKQSNVLGGGGGSGGMREFKVEYGKYSVELRKGLVSKIIREKYGVEAARVVRILLNKGRLDEKHLAKFAMMSLKDSRELCLKLSAGKILELQEVPKTNDRQPSRTFYLFFIDFRKLILNLSMMIRKAQTNVIMRIEYELRKRKNLMAKSNRTDVIEDQDSYLTVWERAEIEKLKKIIEALEVAKFRLERDLFILNDLPWLS